MSSPAGQVTLQGAVFSSTTGRTNRHAPVWLIRVDSVEREKKSEMLSDGLFLGGIPTCIANLRVLFHQSLRRAVHRRLEPLFNM